MATRVLQAVSDDRLFRTVELGYCQAVLLEPWNAPRGRFYVAYRARRGFTSLIGNGVVDEFRTVSGPLLLAPSTLIGSIYDLGMRLAELRDVHAPIDTGWPPLTIGIDASAPVLRSNWQSETLEGIQNEESSAPVPWESRRGHGSTDGAEIDILQCSRGDVSVATIIVTNSPLLPAQLERLAGTDNALVTVAVSTGNRLPYVEEGDFHEVDVVSEARLGAVVEQAQLLLRE